MATVMDAGVTATITVGALAGLALLIAEQEVSRELRRRTTKQTNHPAGNPQAISLGIQPLRDAQRHRGAATGARLMHRNLRSE